MCAQGMTGGTQHRSRIHESREDYLETILMVQQEKGYAHAVDVSRRLGVSKASVSKALARLEREGFVSDSGSRELQLTEAGLAVAERTLERYRFFTSFLVDAGVDPVTAGAEAHHMEHILSDDSFAKVVARYGRPEASTAAAPGVAPGGAAAASGGR